MGSKNVLEDRVEKSNRKEKKKNHYESKGLNLPLSGLVLRAQENHGAQCLRQHWAQLSASSINKCSSKTEPPGLCASEETWTLRPCVRLEQTVPKCWAFLGRTYTINPD